MSMRVTRASWMIPVGIMSVLLLYWMGIPAWLQAQGQWLLQPVLSVMTRGASVHDSWLGPLFRPWIADARIAELEARVAQAVVDQAQLESLRTENASLQEMLQFSTSTSREILGARVVGREFSTRRARLRIDQGSRSGVEVGMPVVVNRGIFIGIIQSVSPQTSIVLLVSDPESRVAAGSSGGSLAAAGLLSGLDDRLAQLSLVPRSVGLKEGDLIVTAGLEDKIPPQLPIGSVRRVDGKPSDAFQTAIMEPFGERQRIDVVGILRTTTKSPTPL